MSACCSVGMCQQKTMWGIEHHNWCDEDVLLAEGGVSAMQLPLLLNARSLRLEIARICKGGVIPSVPSFGGAHVQQLQQQPHELTQLLLQWAAAIGAQYGISLCSTDSGFADGQLLCLLVPALPVLHNCQIAKVAILSACQMTLAPCQ